MAAYLVAHMRVTDPDWLASFRESEYVTQLPTLLAKHGGIYVAAGEHQQVEGPSLGTWTSVIRFPTLAVAEAFWNDPDYQRTAPQRRAGSDSQVVLIDGVE